MLSLHKKLTCYLQLDYAFRTNLDDFCSTVSHGKRTGVETRGGREEEQLAHLVHATGKQIHKELSFLNLAVTYLLKIKIKLDYMIVKKERKKKYPSWERNHCSLPTSTLQMFSHNQWRPVPPVPIGLSCVSRLERSQCGPLCDPKHQSEPALEEWPHTLCPTRPPHWLHALQKHTSLRSLPVNVGGFLWSHDLLWLSRSNDCKIFIFTKNEYLSMTT